ncbi:MAG TPA: hypothetical protein VFV67_34150 [Actinophytocola sp.]|uniref:hypothetical protein n=1 Tax=Actinophytocola sp. TaxID=1872138 RepID=UPI002DBDEA48|nr:hypothetical protein [Actinophytocola sp.]HEU5475711.1 hypothetical protein [Actinophytocola sp.]
MVSLLGLLATGGPTVTLAPYLGDDGEARPTYGAAVLASPARVSPHSRQMQLPGGKVVTLSHVVSVPGDIDLAGRGPESGDRCTIDGVLLRVWTVDTPVWLDGTPMHHKLGVGA